MKAIIDERDGPPEVLQERAPTDAEREQAFAELTEAVRAALETYANVHRGSGHHSTVTTYVYEQAREMVLAYLGRTNATHTVIFCTPRRAATLERQLDPRHYTTLSSQDGGSLHEQMSIRGNRSPERREAKERHEADYVERVLVSASLSQKNCIVYILKAGATQQPPASNAARAAGNLGAILRAFLCPSHIVHHSCQRRS